MFVQRLVRLDRLSEVHVQAVVKLQLEVRDANLAAAELLCLTCVFCSLCSQQTAGCVRCYMLLDGEIIYCSATYFDD